MTTHKRRQATKGPLKKFGSAFGNAFVGATVFGTTVMLTLISGVLTDADSDDLAHVDNA